MPYDLTADLERDIGDGRSVIVAGTGVSRAVSANAPTASWLGLLRSGVDRALGLGRLDNAEREIIDADLALAEASTNLGSLLSVAEKLTYRLGGSKSPEFLRWMADDIGSLEVADARIPRALSAFGIPILTTNYDSLIEDSIGHQSVTYQDLTEVRMVLLRRTKGVVHLHGLWRRAETVILSARDYGQLLGNTSVTALEQSLAAMSSIVFVGCGAGGLADPHFDSLLTWLDRALPTGPVRRYVLCTEAEALNLSGQVGLTPVVYGTTHDDLPAFLDGICPSGGAVEIVDKSGLALAAITERVRQSTLIDRLLDRDVAHLSELLVPPILLPEPPVQFNASRASRRDKVKRLDPQRVAEEPCVVVAGDPDAGVTSAIEWLAASATVSEPSVVPVYLDMQQLPLVGRVPLEKHLRRELLANGSLSHPDAALPPIALALDNVVIGNDKRTRRTVEDLLRLRPDRLYVGCRTGSEADTLVAIDQLKPTVAYIGRVGQRDAARLAALIDDSRAPRLAERVMSLARAESLTRTPRTILLLLGIMVSGEQFLTAISSTSLLEAYIMRVLGRDDPRDSSRTGLDATNRAKLLESLANLFIMKQVGTLPEADVIAHFQEYFDLVDWDESPLEVLTFFRSRGIVQTAGGQVRFTQATYLHLLAARYAVEHESARRPFFEDPLFFEPVMRHYAALIRTDRAAVECVAGLISHMFPEEPIPPHSLFLAGRELPSVSLSSLLVDGARDAADPDEQEDGDEDADFLDLFLDPSPEPFPLDRMDPRGLLARLRAVTLASTVLRDSELVPDASLKQAVLRQVLAAWGVIPDQVAADEEFRAAIDDIRSALLAEDPSGSPGSRSMVFELLSDMAPLFLPMGGMIASLQTTKLIKPTSRLYDDESVLSDPRATLMLSLYACLLQAPGWTDLWRRTHDRHKGTFAFDKFLAAVAVIPYLTSSQQDAESLLDLIVEGEMSHVAFSSLQQKAESFGRRKEELRAIRRRHARQLASGEAPGLADDLDDSDTGSTTEAGS